MKLSFQFQHTDYGDADLNASILEILDSNILCSVATISDSESAYIHTAYYCFNSHLELFFLSDPKSKHVQNLTENNSVSVAVYDSHQPWADDQKGLQLFGTCKQAKGTNLIEATARYLKRFTGLSELIRHADDFAKGALHTRPFIIQVQSLKLYDTERFGDEVFIELSLGS